eukprot:TRINITY_DN2525_c0_g1_i2.p6 TRINITY_DN2525_c0_g1~~TRINITY_DN2525_c0_g1_i2.p6  ORF type:complete len:108 (+),score=23.89 TRINITY_DN2525_c0_g1_i2:3-326(+)
MVLIGARFFFRALAWASRLIWWPLLPLCFFFFFNDTATTEIYTRSIVGSVRCVQETASIFSSLLKSICACDVSVDDEDLLLLYGVHVFFFSNDRCIFYYARLFFEGI